MFSLVFPKNRLNPGMLGTIDIGDIASIVDIGDIRDIGNIG